MIDVWMDFSVGSKVKEVVLNWFLRMELPQATQQFRESRLVFGPR